jgi:hypothetical protein
MKLGWQAKPGLAQVVRVLVTIGPAVLTIVATTLLARALPASDGRDRVLWWIFLLLSCLVLLAVFDRAFRRLAPISTLLKVSLVFPDKAPSRFAVALRAGNTRSIAKRIESIRESGIALDPEDNYATQMLEMIALLGEHDRLTRGHCERVRAYTDLLIEEMGIGDEEANQLRWAALLHDLGKLMVSAEILNKEGRPTEEEWEELKTHPAEGARLALPLSDFLGEWWRAIGEHHERWDGAGYPSGLAGTEIHLGARIVAVADTFDVITSARSYKAPIESEKARAEIARCSGGQFDPRVVRAFLSIGISRLRLVVGPLAWMSGSASLSGVGTVVPAGSIVATAAATLGAVAAVATPTIVRDVDIVAPPIEAPFIQPFESTTTTATSTTTILVAPPTTLPPSSSTTSRPSSTTIAGETASTTVPATTTTGPSSTAPSSTTTSSTTTSSTSPPAPPTAKVDFATLPEGSTVTVDVLANDDSGLILTSVSGGSHAASIVISSGEVLYTHDGSESLNDSFTYTAIDGSGSSVTQSVEITVAPQNDPPTVTFAPQTVFADATALDFEVELVAIDPDDSSHSWEITSSTNPDFAISGSTLTLTDWTGLTAGDTESITVRAFDGSAYSDPFAVTVTVKPPNTAGLLISQFSTDRSYYGEDFVEIYNSSNESRSVGDLFLRITDHDSEVSLTSLGDRVLPAGGYLLFGKDFGDIGGKVDVAFGHDLPKTVGLEILTSSGTVVDAVGNRADPEAPGGQSTPSLAFEGTGLPPLDNANSDNPQTYGRRHANPGACVDTQNNSADFVRHFTTAIVVWHEGDMAPCGGPVPFAGTSGSFIISEFRTDGPGDGDNDFIEIMNPTSAPLPLDGFTLDGDSLSFNFPNVTLQPGEHFLVTAAEYPFPGDGVMSGSPRNGGWIELLDGSLQRRDYVDIGSAADELPKLTRRSENSWGRRYGCQFTGIMKPGDWQHLFVQNPQGLGDVAACPS